MSTRRAAKVAKACAELEACIEAVPYDLPAFEVLVGLEDIFSLKDDAIKFGSGKRLLKEMLRHPETRWLVLRAFHELQQETPP